MPKRPSWVLAVALVTLVVVPVSAQTTPERDREDQADQEGGDDGWFRWRNRPSFQFGDLRLDLRLKLQYDWRVFDPDIDEETGDFRARRGGVNGEIGDHVEFQIERDLNPDGRWRDVFVNWRTFREAEVMVGRFKVPFGREQLTGITDVDFAYRTLASSTIPPARDNGVMLHGRFFGRGLTYEVGGFEADGDNGRLEEAQFAREDRTPPGMGRSFAARVTGAPLKEFGRKFDTLRVGGAYGTVKVPTGLNSLRGENVWGNFEFVEPVYVSGRRQRYGAEFVYTPGPTGFAAEWMQARDERKRQGLGNVDLSDFLSTGWYVSATWFLTGEDKEDFNGPRNPIFTEGFGAIELVARYEELSFSSANNEGQAFPNPRADPYLRNSDWVWTFGVNWFPNRWTRLVVNAIHETFEDDDPANRRTPIRGVANYWSGVIRTQLVF